MKLYLGLLLSILTARIISLAIHFAHLGIDVSGYMGNSVNIISNAIFIIVLAAIVGTRKAIKLNSMASILSIPIFILTVAFIALSGLLFSGMSLNLGLLMVSLVGAIGYYPAGADVPFDYGVGVWAFSALVPIMAGILAGTALRKLRARMPLIGL